MTYLDRPVKRVLSIMPTKYEDIWTAAKGFYKLEPIVADGGEVIIYAPHITQISVMHPHISEIGYHNRDYFLGQWDRFKDQPWGDLAHSTHLRGQGTWDPEHGERNRVTVTLATGIPEDMVRAVNLDYLDPATVDLDAYEADPDTFVVPHAGEVLYRLGSPRSGKGGASRRTRGRPGRHGGMNRIPGFVLALVEPERRVFVAHQGDVGEDPVEPAVDADEQVEQAAGVLPGDQQEEAGDDDEQVEHRVAADGLEAGGPVVAVHEYGRRSATIRPTISRCGMASSHLTRTRPRERRSG